VSRYVERVVVVVMMMMMIIMIMMYDCVFEFVTSKTISLLMILSIMKVIIWMYC